jgi:hypothetical protein
VKADFHNWSIGLKKRGSYETYPQTQALAYRTTQATTRQANLRTPSTSCHEDAKILGAERSFNTNSDRRQADDE